MPMEAQVSPLPRELTTPPVTKIYLVTLPSFGGTESEKAASVQLPEVPFFSEIISNSWWVVVRIVMPLSGRPGPGRPAQTVDNPRACPHRMNSAKPHPPESGRPGPARAAAPVFRTAPAAAAESPSVAAGNHAGRHKCR